MAWLDMILVFAHRKVRIYCCSTNINWHSLCPKVQWHCFFNKFSYFKRLQLVLQVFSCANTACMISLEKPIEQDALEQPYLSVRSSCRMPIDTGDVWSSQHWAVQPWTCDQCSGGATLNTGAAVAFRSRGVSSHISPELSNAVVAESSQILTETLQHLAQGVQANQWRASVASGFHSIKADIIKCLKASQLIKQVESGVLLFDLNEILQPRC